MPFTIATLKALHTLLSMKDRCNIMQMRFVFRQPLNPGKTMNIFLNAGRDKSVRKRHPWVFSGAIARIEGEPGPGDEVRVLNAKGEFLARGFYSPASQIRCRLLRWQDEAIDAEFLQTQIRQAAQLRRQFIPGDTDAYRLINAEGVEPHSPGSHSDPGYQSAAELSKPRRGFTNAISIKSHKF